jgi:sirohydrochlorin cobaltochelatase
MTAHQALVVFAHGSRDPLWRGPVEAVVQRIAAFKPGWYVRAAYLELTEPDLLAVAADWIATIDAPDSIASKAHQTPAMAVFPLFFGVGKHAREDLPQLMDQLRQLHPQARFDLLPSAGTLDAVLDVCASVAIDAVSAAPPNQ